VSAGPVTFVVGGLTGDREVDVIAQVCGALDTLDVDTAERVAQYLAARYIARRQAQEPF